MSGLRKQWIVPGVLSNPCYNNRMHTLYTRVVAATEGMAIAIIIATNEISYAAPCANQPTGGLQDPLKFCSIADFVQGVLEAFVAISLPILSFFIIWAGFRFVAARGNSGKLGDARENFKWLIVGAILILGAWALAQLIANTINQIAG